ncbi:Negative regulator of sexual conjugation and meiosis [Trametes pubescens]|uniref:Negative regulator of sexual conjugation and meiosis n=1 Tax=Trametes pubescens TaxID=154538 RepID=A0A1M2V2B6_TRAPU|nr:Negative regulator of sexual conjugation and meiosis [Trametes pubescens]
MYHSCNIPDLVGHSIDKGRLKLVGTIGSGSNGVIFLAEDTTSGSGSPPTQYAVKCVVRAERNSRRYTLQRQEIHFHQILSSHPNVVTLHRVIEDKFYVFLVLDYCPGGDLFTFLSSSRAYRGDDAFIKRLFLQILDALEACHNAGIYHRDLKPENILISEDAQHIYLTDFGLATANAYSKTYGAGSSLYMSPECIGFDPARLPYNARENDIWALGVILTSMISGHNPWNNACPADACYRAYARNNRFLIEMLPLSPESNILLQHIFRCEAARRASLEEVRAAVNAFDTFFMRPALIARAGPYLRASAATYFEGSPFASVYLLPQASPAVSLAYTEEDEVEGDARGRSVSRRDTPSSVESSSGPRTPEMRAQQPRLEVADYTHGVGSVQLPGGVLAKRPRSMSPAGILRRFMDKFFTE